MSEPEPMPAYDALVTLVQSYLDTEDAFLSALSLDSDDQVTDPLYEAYTRAEARLRLAVDRSKPELPLYDQECHL